MTIWMPEGCLAAARSHDDMARWARAQGDERMAAYCEAWGQWYRDRAEGKPGEDALPQLHARVAK